MKYYDEDDNELVLPTKWEICFECEGEGKSSAYLGAITASEWENEWSFEDQENYMRGHYDKRCECCKGTGKIKVVDRDALDSETLKLVEQQDEDARNFRLMQEAERRFGA